MKYVHEHYYDGWYQYRYDSWLEADVELDRLHRRGTCVIVAVEED